MSLSIETTPRIEELISANAVVAIGVSGGKDSQASALAVVACLDRAGHAGPRLLIHADLGMVEWRESLPACETLASHLGLELAVVRRPAGGLMERWEARWESSKRRYAALETVTLVLPWSTPSMRFCTSELKTHVIGAELRRRFRGQHVVSVTGIRREESSVRAKASIASIDPRLSRPGAEVWNWRPILGWSGQQVRAYIAERGLELHRAYRDFGMSRVSCAFCIMSNLGDLHASASNPAHRELYRRMVELEIASTFAFQGNRWLGDVAPDLLIESERAGLFLAKQRAVQRMQAEHDIPRHMLYACGWPTGMPSQSEAALLASVRRKVGKIVDIPVDYTDTSSVRARYEELMQEHTDRENHAAKVAA